MARRAGLVLTTSAMLGGLACSRGAPIEPARPPSSSKITSPSAPSPEPVPAVETSEEETGDACRHAPPPTPPEPGPAYALVDHVGLVELGEGTVRVVLPSTSDHAFAQMETDAADALWITRWPEVDLLRVTGGVERIAVPRRRRSPEFVAPRARSDVWLATSDIEWRVAHFDGRRLRHERGREAFTREHGYDDNKLNALARIGDTAYVACWNGLFRHDDRGWRRVPNPPAVEPDAIPWSLHATPRGLLVSFADGLLRLEDERWHPVPLPARVDDVNEAGLAVATAILRDTLSLSLHSMDDPDCVAYAPPQPVGSLHDVALDERGRTWLATDTGLTVLGLDAKTIAHWGPGELPGVDGTVRHLRIIRGGPDVLPSPIAAPRWTVRGRLRFVKGGAPVAGRRVLMCPSGFIRRRCAQAPFILSTLTGDDGSFRFVDVPAGDLAFIVLHPEDTDECSGIFEIEPHFVSPGTDCARQAECDLGVRSECLPFEHPPPI